MNRLYAESDDGDFVIYWCLSLNCGASWRDGRLTFHYPAVDYARFFRMLYDEGVPMKEAYDRARWQVAA